MDRTSHAGPAIGDAMKLKKETHECHMKKFVRHEEDKCAGSVKPRSDNHLCEYHFGVEQEARYLGRMA